MEPTIITGLASMGAAGAVIIALYYHQKNETEREKARNESDQKVIDRIDRIVDKHLATEDVNRNQVAALAEQYHGLIDRVITVCSGLGSAIQELSTNTKASERAIQELAASAKANEQAAKANEKAIQDLRAEFRSLGGPQQRRAIGQDEPRPFGS
jgi:uncharacterized protein YgfB (UPF0149 family)